MWHTSSLSKSSLFGNAAQLMLLGRNGMAQSLRTVITSICRAGCQQLSTSFSIWQCSSCLCQNCTNYQCRQRKRSISCSCSAWVCCKCFSLGLCNVALTDSTVSLSSAVCGSEFLSNLAILQTSLVSDPAIPRNSIVNRRF